MHPKLNAAAAGLPLLAYSGGENTVPVIRPELADPQLKRTRGFSEESFTRLHTLFRRAS